MAGGDVRPDGDEDPYRDNDQTNMDVTTSTIGWLARALARTNGKGYNNDVQRRATTHEITEFGMGVRLLRCAVSYLRGPAANPEAASPPWDDYGTITNLHTQHISSFAVSRCMKFMFQVAILCITSVIYNRNLYLPAPNWVSAALLTANQTTVRRGVPRTQYRIIYAQFAGPAAQWRARPGLKMGRNAHDMDKLAVSLVSFCCALSHCCCRGLRKAKHCFAVH